MCENAALEAFSCGSLSSYFDESRESGCGYPTDASHIARFRHQSVLLIHTLYIIWHSGGRRSRLRGNIAQLHIRDF